jgi:cytochrome c oxidase subunit IV
MSPSRARLALLAGVIGPPLFVVVFLSLDDLGDD